VLLKLFFFLGKCEKKSLHNVLVYFDDGVFFVVFLGREAQLCLIQPEEQKVGIYTNVALDGEGEERIDA
jgi:hypothetical protein